MQLEESLRSLEHTHIAAAARAAGLADDDQDDDEAASAALRAKQHVRPAHARGSPNALRKIRGLVVWAGCFHLSKLRD